MTDPLASADTTASAVSTHHTASSIAPAETEPLSRSEAQRPLTRAEYAALVERRIFNFLGTSPDDAHNRRRLIFILLAVFAVLLVIEVFKKSDPARLELVRGFESTIIWLIGIYAGVTVAAPIIGEVSNQSTGKPAAKP